MASIHSEYHRFLAHLAQRQVHDDVCRLAHLVLDHLQPLAEVGGVSEGITSGRQSAQGADGAKVVSDNAGFAEIGQVEVLKTEPRDQQLAVTLGFKNDSDATVRLINLTQTGALLVIDNDGYSNALVALANPDDVTVPAKAGIRQTFVFEGGAEGIKAVRLWGKDLPVK